MPAHGEGTHGGGAPTWFDVINLGHDRASTTMLSDILSIRAGELIAITGSGGKTTLMFRLAHELVSRGMQVITTTTTRILPPSRSESAGVYTDDDPVRLGAQVAAVLPQARHLTVARALGDGKLQGLSLESIEALYQQRTADVILVEADGSRSLPLKAPNGTEPVIPPQSTLVLAVAGLAGIGRLNSEETVFRPDFFARLTGIALDHAITPESVSKVLLHAQGLLRGTPDHARVAVVLNQADCEERIMAADAVARHILGSRSCRPDLILVTRLQPEAEVITRYER